MEMSTTGLESIQSRLARLERDHRNLKWSVVFVLIGLLVLSWAAEKRGRTWIEAESFVLKDEQSVIRGIFSTIGGDASLKLNGTDGKVQAEMHVASFGPSFALYNTEGKGVARLSLSPRGTALYFFDAEQKPRMAMTFGPQGTVLKLADERGTDRITLGVQSVAAGTGSPQEQQAYSLIITDQEGKTLFTVPQSIP